MPTKLLLSGKQQRILDVLTMAGTDLSVAEIQKVTGFATASVSDILRTRLLPHGFVRRIEHGRYEATGKPA